MAFDRCLIKDYLLTFLLISSARYTVKYNTNIYLFKTPEPEVYCMFTEVK